MSEDSTVQGKETTGGSFKEDLDTLLRVQDRDMKLLTMHQTLEERPRELQRIRDGLAAFEQRVAAAKDGVKKETVAKNALETELEGRQQSIAKHETQLLQLKSNEEYRAMVKEIETLKTGNGQIEDKILESMEKIEQAQKDVRQQEAALKEEQARSARREKVVQEEIEGIEGRIAELGKERAELVSGVQPRLMERYRMVLENKHGVAMVPIEHGACGGCHMALTPQVINEVKRCHEIVTCESCARILYLVK